MARSKDTDGRKVVCRNSRALHDFFIDERFEAGLVLRGTEVKALRDARASLQDAYATVEGGEVFLVNMNIPQWPGAAYFNHEPKRRRKLLLHAKQIHKLFVEIKQRGCSLIPLSVYFTEKNRAKVELGLARGKRKYDKRHAIRERDERRQSERES